MENRVFNIVYENWDESGKPIPNLKKEFGDKLNFNIDSFGIVQHWWNETKSTQKYKIQRCKMQDVSVSPNENFYYMIGYYCTTLHDLVTTISPLTDLVIHYLRTFDNFKVLFHSEHESDNEKSFISFINYLKSHNVDESKIYLVNNNDNLNLYKEKYSSNLNVHSIKFIPSSSTIVLDNLGGCKFIKEKEGKFFMCFNKRPSTHRVGLLAMMKKYNLLDNTNWSFVPNHRPYINLYSFFKFFNDSEELLKENEKYIHEILDTQIKRSEYEEDKGWFNVYQEMNLTGLPHWMRTPELVKNYENSYFNIVTESQYHEINNVVHITEKSFKPFYHYQFAMILASHNHVKRIKEKYDLDFFDDIINHSYDNEKSDYNRLIMFVEELKRINENKETFIEFYKNNFDRFEKNKQKVRKILEIEDDFNFFNELSTPIE